MDVNAFLADDAAVENNKLFTLGAGWDVIRTQMLPTRHHRMAVAMVITVPYTATNQPHKFEVYIEHEDGERVLLNEMGQVPDGQEPLTAFQGEFTMGRPPALPSGAEQRIPVAMKMDNVVFNSDGFYAVVIEIDGSVERRLPFRVEVPPGYTLST